MAGLDQAIVLLPVRSFEARYSSDWPGCRRADARRIRRDRVQFLAVLRCEPVPERPATFYAAVKLARQQRASFSMKTTDGCSDGTRAGRDPGEQGCRLRGH